MKIGSIVECINPFLGTKCVKPVPKGIYVIRAIPYPKVVYLEEIINQIIPCTHYETGCIVIAEPGYDIERFREIQFPPSLEQEINELLKEPCHV